MWPTFVGGELSINARRLCESAHWRVVAAGCTTARFASTPPLAPSYAAPRSGGCSCTGWSGNPCPTRLCRQELPQCPDTRWGGRRIPGECTRYPPSWCRDTHWEHDEQARHTLCIQAYPCAR